MQAPYVPPENRRQLPDGDDIYLDDWLFVKPIRVAAGEAVVQHVHEYDHATLVALGTIQVWIDGTYSGEFTAPRVLSIKAGEAHRFLARSDALLYCVHNLRGEAYPALRTHVED